ncbi:unnamed protein product [Oikopleura dioica]|uniref:Uncharacterized protein n=1 Tax=Oikopleura dioica TaxID=34765 RepID=E4XXU4_OIKDI|nr:unnamed protein product [Oikopleura dioica]
MKTWIWKKERKSRKDSKMDLIICLKLELRITTKNWRIFCCLVESRKFAILDLLGNRLEEKVTGKWDICRRGSKFRYSDALFSGSPGFSNQNQLTGNYGNEANYFYFLFCDWKTSWSLLYRPIDEKERKNIDKKIQVLKYVFDNF